MKALNKKATLSLVALTLMLTACNPPADAGNTPAPTATATVEATVEATPSATPSPTETVTQSAEEIEAGYDQQVKDAEKAWAERPLGVDMDVLFKENIADDVLTVFPEEQFNTKEGVRSALETYALVNSMSAWHQARDTTQDFAYIAPYTDLFDASMMADTQADIAKHGAFKGILTVPADGVIQVDGNQYKVVDNSFRVSYNHPSVQVGATGDLLYIEGTRAYTYDLEGGEVFEGSYTYYITTKPVGDGKWIITSMGYGHDDKSTSGLKGE